MGHWKSRSYTSRPGIGPGLERPHAAVQRGHVHDGLPLLKKGGPMVACSAHEIGRSAASRALEVAGDVDDVLALHHLDGPRERLLHQRKRDLQDDRAQGSGILRRNHLCHLLGRFAVERHARGPLLIRRRAETIQRKKMTDRRQWADRLPVAQQQIGKACRRSPESSAQADRWPTRGSADGAVVARSPPSRSGNRQPAAESISSSPSSVYVYRPKFTLIIYEVTGDWRRPGTTQIPPRYHQI